MQKYRVELLRASYDDLDEIFDYIALDNPRAAERMLDTINTTTTLVMISHPTSIALKENH